MRFVSVEIVPARMSPEDEVIHLTSALARA